MVGGELFSYGIAVIFHAPDDCQGPFFPRLATLPYQSNFRKTVTCLALYQKPCEELCLSRADLKVVCLTWLVPSIAEPGMR